MRVAALCQALLLAAVVHAVPHSPFKHRTHVKKQASSPKYVFVHFMVGNAYPYTPKMWEADITLAHANGIDAFALNVGSDDWQPARVADA